ncbi:helix-turn-helix domain-containing protein [Desulfotomaculum copahuensis]|uniref:Transposase putative helix-turn-helix domain-containing protein n=1 Tax=Desulfotomaculum copahuensis TaxID=1838280 RepID=A0A1B7LBM9_9FIRM|nr:helix-turn-helix domain-containing protein [Desulfotomaculum copahuensis]OAT79859.1 hypothetical protein A6M21_14765 [Desulfotomaculum copahuensis]
MKINRACRYELKPDAAQRILLAKHAGTVRFAYNWGLDRRILLYQEEKKPTNAMAQHRELNQLKQTEHPWMYEVSKCAPREALRDLDRAFKNFFAGLKAGRKHCIKPKRYREFPGNSRLWRSRWRGRETVQSWVNEAGIS